MRRLSDRQPVGSPLGISLHGPVRPNRAQEILYGPTLEEFLYGEQIGRTLVERGGEQTTLLCTDSQPMMSLRPLVSQPLALVCTPSDDNESASRRRYRVDPQHDGPPAARMLTVRGCQITPAPAYAEDLVAIDELLPALDGLDLAEPFERIRAAIIEAQGF